MDFYSQSSAERITFLSNRYSVGAGLSNRQFIWQDAMQRIARNPVLGRGTGAAETVISNSFHNTYLEVWYNTGILGLTLFVCSQLYLIFRAIILSRKVKDLEFNSLLTLSLGYMLGFVALSFVESPGAGSSNLNIILYIFIGVFVSNPDLFQKSVHPSSSMVSFAKYKV